MGSIRCGLWSFTVSILDFGEINTGLQFGSNYAILPLLVCQFRFIYISSISESAMLEGMFSHDNHFAHEVLVGEQFIALDYATLDQPTKE